MLAKDAILYADGGGKTIASPVPLFGAAVIAQFMAGVARVRRDMGSFEIPWSTSTASPAE